MSRRQSAQGQAEHRQPARQRRILSLARRTQGLDHIIDALQQGRIGFEAAQLIARIATPSTERAWLTRATRRTFKHLRE